MPYRVDNTEIESIFGTLGYLSNKSPQELANLILKKLYATGEINYPEPVIEIDQDEDYGFFDYMENALSHLDAGNIAVENFTTCMSKMTESAERLGENEISSKFLVSFGEDIFQGATELDKIRIDYLNNIKIGADYTIKSLQFVIDEMPEQADEMRKNMHDGICSAHSSVNGFHEAIAVTLGQVEGIPKLKKEIVKAKRELIRVLNNFKDDTKEILVLLQILIDMTASKKGDS